MKLYSTVCWGLLVVFLCSEPKQHVVSSFCSQVAPEVAKLQGLSDGEIAALSRQRKEAILELRLKYKKLCS